MIILKLYLTLVATGYVGWLVCMVYSTIADELKVGDFGAKMFMASSLGALVGIFGAAVGALWSV